jgi:hypothetical protein
MLRTIFEAVIGPLGAMWEFILGSKWYSHWFFFGDWSEATYWTNDWYFYVVAVTTLIAFILIYYLAQIVEPRSNLEEYNRRNYSYNAGCTVQHQNLVWHIAAFPVSLLIGVGVSVVLFVVLFGLPVILMGVFSICWFMVPVFLFSWIVGQGFSILEKRKPTVSANTD